jgi:hypothetical protein
MYSNGRQVPLVNPTPLIAGNRRQRPQPTSTFVFFGENLKVRAKPVAARSRRNRKRRRGNQE